MISWENVINLDAICILLFVLVIETLIILYLYFGCSKRRKATRKNKAYSGRKTSPRSVAKSWWATYKKKMFSRPKILLVSSNKKRKSWWERRDERVPKTKSKTKKKSINSKAKKKVSDRKNKKSFFNLLFNKAPKDSPSSWWEKYK